MDTLNVDEVQAGRGAVAQWLVCADNTVGILRALRTPGSRPLSATFRHQLAVQDGSESYEATWLVTNGVHRGPGDALLMLAEEMSADGERALPVAGAAARLRLGQDGGVKADPVQGRAYCGLPLPRPTALNIHVNGYFELDANRDWLRLNPESVGHHEQQRLRWNRDLLAHGVASSVAVLIAALVDQASEATPAELYALWPDPSKTGDAVLPGLAKAVYDLLWREGKEIVAVDPAAEDWATASQVTVVPTDWWPRLRAPLAAAGWKLPDPELPPHVLSGFADAGHPLPVLTPAQLRQKWRRKNDVSCALSDAPDPAWRDRRWVTDLLSFCLSDKSNDLAGLPLAIYCDGHLHTFGFLGGATFLATEEQRAIFPFPAWFVDPVLAAACGLVDTPAASLRTMTTRDVVKHLDRVLRSRGATSAWQPNGEELPNAEWLTRVFKYLADSRALSLADNVTQFRELAIVPDQFDRLHAPGTFATPLWAPAKKAHAAIENVMGAFRVPVVSGSKGLMKALERALDASKDELVWPVTAHDLIDVLHSTQGEWEESAATYTPEIHDQLIDFLADWDVSKFGDDHVERLGELKIFPTRDRELATAVEDDVFLVEDGKLPSLPGERRLFNARPASWRRLLKRAGAQVLDGMKIVETILDEGIASLSTKRQLDLLTWLRENLDRVLSPLDDEEGEEVLRRLGEAPLFPGDDGGLHAAATLYDPAVTVAREILGPSAVFLAPDSALADHASLWRGFCERLGMATTLRPDDIVEYVDLLAERAEKEGVASVADAVLGVFDHVRDHWVALGSAPLEDDEHETLAEALANRAWLPSQQRREKLQGFAAAVVPEDRLYQAHELFTPGLGHLVSSQAPIAPFVTPSREVISGLGFLTVAPVSTVLAHLEHVLEVWHSEEEEKPPTEALQKTLGAIYRDLGNRLGGDISADEDDDDTADDSDGVDTTLEDVRARFAGVPCLWDDPRQRFWPPEKTFRAGESLGHRRARLSHGDQQRDRGYTVLGRRDEPDVAALLDLLDEIERDQAGAPLNAEDVSVVASVLRRINNVTDGLSEQEREIALLTREGCLVAYSLVYDDDAGAYMNGIRPGAVHIVHRDVPRRLRSALRIRSLARALHRELATAPQPAFHTRAQRVCEELQETMRSPEFEAGLRRFIKDRAPEAGRLNLDWLRGVEVCVVEPFETVLWLVEDGERREVGSGRSQFHLDVERLSMYVSVDAYDAATSLIARGIQQQLGLDPLGDLSPLSNILRAEPQRIDALLTTLSVRVADEDADKAWDAQEDAEDAPMSFGDVEDEWDDSPEEGQEAPQGVESEELEAEPTIEASPDPEAVADGAADDADTADEDDADIADEEDENTGDEDDAIGDAGVNRSEVGERPSGSAVSEGSSPGEYADPGRRAPASNGRGPSEEVGQSGGGREHAYRPGSDATHPPSAGGRPAGGTGIPDPEARRSRPQDDFSRDGSPSSRDAGEARASVRPTQQGPSRRVVTYIVSATGAEPVESDAGDDESPANMTIGRAAEEHVEAEETRADRLVERMPHNNPGFDVLSIGAAPGDVRFIEVKGVSGAWGAAGVPLSARQFAKAWQERDRFWLYVVEYAEDPVRRRVTRLQDPVGKVTQYRVDSGWRSLGSGVDGGAPRPDTGTVQPDADDQLTLPDGRSGTILEVRGAGMLVQLSVQFPDGDVETLLYKPDRMTITKRTEG